MDNYSNNSGYHYQYTQNPFDPSSNFVSYPSLSTYPQLNNHQYENNQQTNLSNLYSLPANNWTYQQEQLNKQAMYKKKMKSHFKANPFRKASSPYSKPSTTSQQLYCDLCKVSCAGEQSYKDHCDGQKHKKKEAGLNQTNGRSASYFCELCQVPCSCLEAYNAHLSGKNHNRVCNLQTKLGKEVPTELMSPIVKSESGNFSNAQNESTKNSFRVIGTPAINFVKGELLRTMANDTTGQEDAVADEKENTTENVVYGVSTNDSQIESAQNSQMQIQSTQSQNDEQIPLLNEPMLTDNPMLSTNEPVGLEFIFEYKVAGSKATYYSCELCNCKFSEKNAKEQHVRGKRHHKAYNLSKRNGHKPNIPAINASSSAQYEDQEAEPSPPPLENLSTLPLDKPPKISSLLNGNKSSTPRLTPRTSSSTPIVKQPNFEASYAELEAQFVNDIDLSYEVDDYTSHDDKYMYKKHAEIVPREDEIKMFYKKVYIVERNLKYVSDELQNKELIKELLNIDHTGAERILAGELRAGLFGKKLLLNGEKLIELILICSVKPNVPLLKKIADILSAKLESSEEFGEFKFEVNIPESAVDIRTTNDIHIRITLTSLLFRSPIDDNPTDDNELNREKCLEALTLLRRMKWYQNKIHPFNPCPMVVRILRDFCKRIDAWKPLTDWCLELICERVLSSCLSRPTASEALKCILQALAAGIILIDPKHKDNVILPDPCEFGCKDALACLDEKQRIDLTESAKNLVQLILFNKIYQVLDTSVLKDEESKTDNTDNTNDKLNDAKDSQ